MAVLGRLLVGSGERLDLADLLSIDSYVAADFKYLIKSFVGATKPYILHGLDVINPQDAIGTENISLRIADSVVYYPGSQAGAFYYGLEAGNINAQPLIPELRKNATNFVYLTFGTFDTARDSRAFWDPDQNGGDGGEFSQDVNTQTALKIEVNVSVSTFPENTIPICKVVVGPSVISSIEDCRDHFFRLGTGGISPDPFSSYSFRDDPSAPYSRLEPPSTMTSALNPNPFQGGDKNIRTLKEWMDAVMTRIKEIGGTTYWYQGPGVPGAGPNVNNVFLDSLGSTIKSKGEWQHSGSIPGQATWTQDIHYYSLVDARNLIVRANTITLATSDKVAWINLNRDADFNPSITGVDWQNGINYVNGVVNAFANLSVGDWVKKNSDASSTFLRVEQLNSGINLSGTSTTAALAQSIKLSGNYAGLTGTEAGRYTQGEYLLSDINITDRNDSLVTDAGGNFFWLAYRSDTSLGLATAVSTSLSLDITDHDGETARCTATAHGLLDKDRVTIVGGAFAGTYVIEYESANVFNINKTAALIADDLARAAYYGLITTAARSTVDGYALESAQHGFKSGEQITVAGASPWDGSYTVNYRSATQVQVALGSALATTGPVDGEIVSLARLNVRTEFGTVKVVQGENTNIGDSDSTNLLSYIGMDSLAQTYPLYSIPGSANTINGAQNYNSLPTDNLTTRVSRLTAMMAGRVQDRGIQLIGRTNLVNVTSGANQQISALANISLKRPGGNDLTVNLTSVIAIPANSVAVIDIDRDSAALASITPTVESWGSNYLLSENKIILFYRFADTAVYTWDGSKIDPSGHLNLHKPEDSQNRNIWVINPGTVRLNISTSLLTLDVKEAAETTRVKTLAAAAVPQSSYIVAYSAKDAEKYVIWYNKDTLGVQPVVAGTTVYIEVAITTGDTAATVASATITAINLAASVELTASSHSSDTVLLKNDAVGTTTTTAHGAVSTTFVLTTTQVGFDPDIQVFMSGSADNNIVDVDAINALGTLTIVDGQSAWVRVNRFAPKTFNTVVFVDLPDTDVAGSIYVTSYANIPIDQDVFVLWSRVGNSMLETHHGHRPDANVYDETFKIVAGPPANVYERTGPSPAGTEMIIPLDSRDSGFTQEYVVGAGMLEVFLNGQYLRTNEDWLEVGDNGGMSRRIIMNQPLQVADYLTFRIDTEGAVYFAASTSGNTSLQDAYDTGRFIDVGFGLPIVITGFAGQKLLDVQGDMNVDGVIDPAGITFTQQATDPLAALDYGIWRNALDQFIFKHGASAPVNLATDFIRRDGTLSMSASLNLNSNRVINLAAPVDPNDASRKTDLDAAVTAINLNFIKRDGTNSMLANLNLNNYKITNLGAPISADDATNKTYVDTNFLKVNGTNAMTGNLNFGSQKGINVAEPTALQDATTKNYVDVLNAAGLGRVKITLADTTVQFLGASIVAGAALTSTVVNPGGDETLQIDVAVDNSTIEVDSDALRVKDLGITTAKLANDAVTTVKITDLNVTTAKIADLNVTNAKIATGVDATKIADGSVSNTEFQFINSVTSNVQTQLDSKVAKAGSLMDSAANITFSGGGEVRGLPATPSTSGSATSKAYVDAKIIGLSPKQAVRAATLIAGTLASSFEAGDMVDGVTLATNDRLLIKNQVSAADNGIYTVNATGAPTRAIDFDEVAPINEINGAWVSVQEGSQQGKVFVQYGVVVTVGIDPINFQFYDPIASLVGGDMINVSGSTIAVDLAAVSGLESTNVGNAAGQLRVKLEASNPSLKIDGSNQLGAKLDASGAITSGAGGLIVGVDNSTTELASNAVRVKDLGITTAKLADDAVTTIKITDFNVTAAKLATDSVTTVKIADLNVTTAKLADNAVTTVKITDFNVTAAKLATDSVTTIKITDLNVTTAKLADNAVTTIKITDSNVTLAKLASDSVDENKIVSTAHDATLFGGSGSKLSVVSSPAIQASGEIAGTSYAATTLFAVRYGQNAETAGHIYKADNDTTSVDNFHVIGLALTVGALSAANTMPSITKLGLLTVTGHGFTIGKPLWLGTSGALTSTVPSAALSANVMVGMVKDANTIDVRVQIMGVNQ